MKVSSFSFIMKEKKVAALVCFLLSPQSLEELRERDAVIEFEWQGIQFWMHCTKNSFASIAMRKRRAFCLGTSVSVKNILYEKFYQGWARAGAWNVLDDTYSKIKAFQLCLFVFLFLSLARKGSISCSLVVDVQTWRVSSYSLFCAKGWIQRYYKSCVKRTSLFSLNILSILLELSAVSTTYY